MPPTRTSFGDRIWRQIEQLPRLTFWYNTSPRELLRTPPWLRALYIEHLDELIAEWQLYSITVSAFPYYAQQHQRETIKELTRRLRLREQAEPEQPKPPADPRQYFAQLAEFGVGGRYDLARQTLSNGPQKPARGPAPAGTSDSTPEATPGV